MRRETNKDSIEENLLNEINSDNPVKKLHQDKFQRYEYAKRIAKLVSTTKHDKSLVVGVFGKWGEGKTSILNFIKGELNDNCIQLEFNPWLFTDEKQLLSSFFFTLAGKLQKKILNEWKKVGKYLKDYSAILGSLTLFFGYNSEKQIKNLGDKLSENSIEELKSKLGNILKDEEKKIVVFIDDIDRLTSKEIQSIFKLVKNAGDFSNVVYVLAFDDEIVAKSLAPEYGDSNSSYGYNFLEKIIQIPLRIPVVNRTLIKEYTYELIEKVLEENQLILTQNELTEFQDRFEIGFLNDIDNPRFSLRYSNNISFVIPLLKGEVNLVDLMLIEAIKVFRPELYGFISDNKHFFLEDYSSFSKGYIGNDDYKNKAKEHLEKGFSEYSNSSLTILVLKLFPNLDDIFPHSGLSFNNQESIDPNKERRVCSSEYFDKYFQYTVPKGIISDIYFDKILGSLETSEYSDIKDEFSSIFTKYSPNDILTKINLRMDEFSVRSIKSVIKLLAVNNKFFPIITKYPTLGGINRYAIITILSLFKKIDKSEHKFFIGEIVSSSDSCEFSYELYKIYNSQPGEDKMKEVRDSLIDKIVELFKKKLKSIDFFEITNDETTLFVIKNWVKGDLSLWNLMNKENQNSIEQALKMVKVFLPTYYGSHLDHPYKSKFVLEDFKLIKEYLDVNIINNVFISKYGDIAGGESKHDEGEELSNKEIVGLFQKFYKEVVS
ncbi:MAG: hypothetical protein H6549_10850 [Chitinophagales bacterium]|nr:hypothetical protein [Chitinophagales bacterium]